jgi:Fis family transcriptional regulator, factor for inversion stimulation protein
LPRKPLHKAVAKPAHRASPKAAPVVREGELSVVVRRVMRQYFKDLEGENTCGIYDMVVLSVEKPLLEVVMVQAQGNQTRAAELLGLNRNTLRKKLQQHGLE